MILLPLTDSDFENFWFAGLNLPKKDENRVLYDFVFFFGNGGKLQFFAILRQLMPMKNKKN